MKELTIEPVAVGNTSQTLPEFGRVNDVQKIFGVKRGILYRWIKEQRIKSVCIREAGNIQGVRLIHLASEVKDNLLTQDDCFLAYVEFCKQRNWMPMVKPKANGIIEEQIMLLFAIGQRNDIPGLNGKAQRGWKGVKVQ
jgi:hypothetical protein